MPTFFFVFVIAEACRNKLGSFERFAQHCWVQARALWITCAVVAMAMLECWMMLCQHVAFVSTGLYETVLVW